MARLRTVVWPLLFVALYGSGFVGTRLGLPYAPPFLFLALRFALAAAVLALLAQLLRAPWPGGWRQIGCIVGAGLLTVGGFSAGVIYSLALGLPPAISALIIALQPLLVTLGAALWLGERLHWRKVAGLLFGLLGVWLVLQLPDLASGGAAVGLSGLALLALSAGTLYQKARCADMHLLTGGALQCLACAALTLLAALLFEPLRIDWTVELLIAWWWMALPVSVGALSILYHLLRDGEASRVASLFYLVPVAAALTAWLLFGQSVAPAQWAGMATVAFGVLLAARPSPHLQKNRGDAGEALKRRAAPDPHPPAGRPGLPVRRKGGPGLR